MTQVCLININEIREKIKNESADLFLITDTNLWKTYKNIFADLSISKRVWALPAGEESKNFNQLGLCLESLLALGINRNSKIIAFGGGVVGDFAGLVASLVLRGVEWINIPTTHIAMFDASIGGKVAVNSNYAKNQIGSFYPAQEVWLTLSFLETVAKSEEVAARGELLKYALLNQKIFNQIAENWSWEKVIFDCIELKKSICEQDLKEKGLRKILNFGHSFGHAYEFHFKLPHGMAVNFGIQTILEIIPSINRETKNKAYQIINYLELPRINQFKNSEEETAKRILKLISFDKKKVNQKEIELIGLEEIGKPKIQLIPFSLLSETFIAFWTDRKKHE